MLGGNIELQAYEDTAKDKWNLFRQHHYLTHDFNKGARVFNVYWNGNLVAMNSILNMPSGTLKYAYREHRLVVLPDFQGLGFGTKISEFIGEYLLSQGYKFFSRTTHIRLGNHRKESPLWNETSTNQVQRKNINEMNANSTQGQKYKRLDDKRIAYSFEYVGKDYFRKDHQIIVCDGECPKENAEKMLNSIIDKNKMPIIVTSIASMEEINIWEQIARERVIRTEVYKIKRKGEYYLNQSCLPQTFEAILLSKESQDFIQLVKHRINKCIWLDFSKEIPTLATNFDTHERGKNG